MKRQVILALLAGSVVLGVTAVGCQTYDFEPVTPQTWVQSITYKTVDAKHFKPNLWLLVDKSGSMSTSDVPVGGGTTTRMAALKTAMDGFLSNPSSPYFAGESARMALTFFPADNRCAAPSDAAGVAVPLPEKSPDDVGTEASLRDQANRINAQIQGKTTGGGTPTGASVAFVGSQPSLQDASDGRDDFILLLTDGMPNCNDANLASLCGCKGPPSTCSPAQVDQCRCTTDDKCLASFCSQGCLDQDGSVAAIAEQKKTGVRTIVLAFGRDTNTGDAAETLAAMATAGGANLRECPNGTDGECGAGDSCVVTTKLCRRQYFKASNAEELAEGLKKISDAITGNNPCEFTLVDPPTSQQYVAVIVNQENIPAGPATWSFTGRSVLFEENSTYCASLKARSSSTKIEIRYVQKL